jgi:hypothetical protein
MSRYEKLLPLTHTDCHVRVRNCTGSRDVCYASQTAAIPRGTRGRIDRRRNWRRHRNCVPVAVTLALSVDQTTYRPIGNVSPGHSDVGQLLAHRLKDYAAVPLAGLGDFPRRCYKDIIEDDILSGGARHLTSSMSHLGCNTAHSN